ncbi:hypothetical protein [Halomonas icarae]|uniref:Uncharacterized protein n=1 Tax=Halomonas icarae TaxID=2691040 RepID=A0A7X4W1B4_9GAMM|nr:hypothetical protein [Halomonas icarae]MDR5900651.1 hypothetical protein [Halomonas icarae]NAW13880.1 hypothetical protein [Halomonas icarae]
MTSEPQRLQYLEAMGLTAWVARYALPNAHPTPACEWELPERPPEVGHGQRLQALLDEAREQPAAPPAESPAQERTERVPRPGKARAALLGDMAPLEEVSAEAEPSRAMADEAPREALRFAFQVACLEGRWLLVLPGDQAPGRLQLMLLANLLRAAGIESPPPVFQDFRWPLQEGLPVQEPLVEAREGLKAFVAGASRRGWEPERLLVFGRDEVLERVLSLEGEHCPLFGLPAWQGPSLAELVNGAEAKRALLPRLLALGEAWRETQGGASSEQ